MLIIFNCIIINIYINNTILFSLYFMFFIFTGITNRFPSTFTIWSNDVSS